MPVCSASLSLSRTEGAMMAPMVTFRGRHNAVFCEVQVSLFVAGAVFREVQVSLFVAGAVFQASFTCQAETPARKRPQVENALRQHTPWKCKENRCKPNLVVWKVISGAGGLQTDGFMVGPCSDRSRIMVGSAAHWKWRFQPISLRFWTVIFRGRRSIWWVWTMTHALRIVNSFHLCQGSVMRFIFRGRRGKFGQWHLLLRAL